jgi:uncharacterized protein YdeI (YjbR/CyaY-like superfamily)
MNDTQKDFSDALKKSGLAKFFSDLAPSHRREYLKWIDEAKRPATRKGRIEKTIKMLSHKAGQKTAHSKKNV